MRSFLTFLLMITGITTGVSQSIHVDVNLDMMHQTGDVSTFNRERNINVHSSLIENEWQGEEEKLNYLINDLNVWFGRDNGAATWCFKQTPKHPSVDAYPDLQWMETEGLRLRNYFSQRFSNADKMGRKNSMRIMGTNPHTTYPCLTPYSGYWSGRPGSLWYPTEIETSSDWVVNYLENYFAQNENSVGEALPRYWEVMNEPDHLLNTNNIMFSSWEELWAYHNLVAQKVKQRLGDKAPLIGGMAFGYHSFHEADVSHRFAKQGYSNQFFQENDPLRQLAFEKTKSAFWGDGTQHLKKSYQWDVIWKGFIDSCGQNMDFYSLHIYDLPQWKSENYAIRKGGNIEGILDMIEWYDVNKYGKQNRKPLIISEFGAYAPYIGNEAAAADPKRRDWENLKSYSSMLMQFLERPDYIIKTVPYNPIKGEWGDLKDNPYGRFPFAMMQKDKDNAWQWSEFIKFYELWSDVNGIRIDTYSDDRDLQVDAYVEGNHVYLILNNLETINRDVKLQYYGNEANPVVSVKKKQLFLDTSIGMGEGWPNLVSESFTVAPVNLEIGAEATVILDYTFAHHVEIIHQSQETKFYAESLSGSVPNRVSTNGQAITAHINHVEGFDMPGEATLRIGGLFLYSYISEENPENQIFINGNRISYNPDWRGEVQSASNYYFGVLEIPFDKKLLQADNEIVIKLQGEHTLTNVSLQVWNMSRIPGRTGLNKTSTQGNPHRIFYDENQSSDPYVIWQPNSKAFQLKNIKGKSYDAYVFDLQGKKCLYFNDLKDEIWVDASALKKGFYVLQVVGENSNKSFKINVME
nr:beta-agarase [uncultured bacterium]